MSHSVKSLDEEILMDSWVDLNGTGELSRGSDSSQKRSTPISSLLSSGKLEKLLLEAQRESCQSSLVGSAVSSHRDSPKSPRSPVVEDASLDDLLPPQQCDAGQRRHGSTDWIWEWSSKPEQRPPKYYYYYFVKNIMHYRNIPPLPTVIPKCITEWKLQHPPRSSLSLRNSRAAKSGLFSTEMLTIIFVSNLLSVLIGFGIGCCVYKRGPVFHWNRH